MNESKQGLSAEQNVMLLHGTSLATTGNDETIIRRTKWD
jgi:hypothetical protein